MKHLVQAGLLILVLGCHIALLAQFGQTTPLVELNAINLSSAALYDQLSTGFVTAEIREGTLDVDGEPRPVRLVRGNLRQYRDFSLLYGSFFGIEAVQLGLNCAVISEELSYLLFGKSDSVGEFLPIQGDSYEIIGVYRQKRSFCTDGEEPVYLPSGSAAEQPLSAKSLTCRLWVSDGVEKKPFLLQRVEAALHPFPEERAGWTLLNFTDCGKIAAQSVQCYFLLLEIGAIILLLTIWIKAFQREVDYLKVRLTRQYFSEYLEENSVHLLIQLIYWVVGAFLFVWLLLCVFRYTPYLPPGFLSKDRLFDIAHYRRWIVYTLQNVQQGLRIPPSSYQSFVLLTLPVAWLFFTLECSLTIPLLHAARNRIRGRR